MRVSVTEQAIDVNRLLASVARDGHGAALLFLGTVRDLNEGRRVIGIRYEAYHEMAERVLGEIATETEARTGGCELRVVHRTGELQIGEASVAIALSTPHRAQAFDAARYVIEEIKKRLPVWKHERYADGAPAWVRGVAPEAATSLTSSSEEVRVDE